MIKKIISVLLISAFLVSLAACGKGDGTGAAIFFPIEKEPASLDPQLCSNRSEETVINNIYEGLMRLDKDGRPVPGAAEAVSVSTDGLVYSFTIRSGAKWHLIKNFEDLFGEDYEDNFNNDLTAADFVFGMRRAVTPSTKAPDAKFLFPIKNAEKINRGQLAPSSLGIAAVGDKKLTVTLEKPCAEFLSVLAMPVSMPCNERFFNATKGRYGLDLKYTMCNGPFYLSKWSYDTSMYIKQNPDYVGASVVKPASVTLFFDGDTKMYPKKLSDSTYDAVPVTEADLGYFNDKFRITEFKNTVWCLCVNCKDEMLSNTYLRHALLQTFDRGSLDFPGDSEEAGGIVPDCCEIGGLNYRRTAGNVGVTEKNSKVAVAYRDKAFEELKITSFSVTVLCTEETDMLVKQIIQTWQKYFGITVRATSRTAEQSEIENEVASGRFQIAILPLSTTSSFTPVCLSSYTSSSDKNILRFSSGSFDSGLKKAFTSASASAAASAYKAAESALIKSGAVYPLYKKSEYLVSAERAEGIATCPAGDYISFASVLSND
ncbi:MAG: peptide ABC transporter substrate-binding protein [Clostridiales bacterium]|nr:peptide ABC transporter substrate-binding protein [Clostridiales bacterium]